jgi:hypothetical protein
MLFRLGGHYDPYRDDKTLVRLDYDFLQVLHIGGPRLRRPRAPFPRYGVARGAALAVARRAGGIRSHDARHPRVPPGAVGDAVLLDPRRRLRVRRRSSTGTANRTIWARRSAAFRSIATGCSTRTGVNQLFFFLDRRLAVTLGYAYEEATPAQEVGRRLRTPDASGAHQLSLPGLVAHARRARVRLPLRRLHGAEHELADRKDAPGRRQLRGDVRPQADPHRPQSRRGRFVLRDRERLQTSPCSDYSRHIVAFELRYSF